MHSSNSSTLNLLFDAKLCFGLSKKRQPNPDDQRSKPVGCSCSMFTLVQVIEFNDGKSGKWRFGIGEGAPSVVVDLPPRRGRRSPSCLNCRHEKSPLPQDAVLREHFRLVLFISTFPVFLVSIRQTQIFPLCYSENPLTPTALNRETLCRS
jgi:hypothetical protein